MTSVAERCGTIKKLCRYVHLIPNMISSFQFMSASTKNKADCRQTDKEIGVLCFMFMINICS